MFNITIKVNKYRQICELVLKMKLEKTYRDFVNQVITEAGKKHGPAFEKLMKGLDDKLTKWKQDRKKDREDLTPNELQKYLVAYSEAFFLQNIEENWNGLNKYIVNFVRDKESNQLTPYQFVALYFKFFFQEVFGKSIDNFIKFLDQASQIIEMDESYYKKNTVKKVFKALGDAKKYKTAFVAFFNRFKRNNECYELLQNSITEGYFTIKGLKIEKRQENNNTQSKTGEKNHNVSKLTIALLDTFNEAAKTNNPIDIDSKGFRDFLADDGFEKGNITKADFLKAVYLWATGKQLTKYTDTELERSFNQIVKYYPKRKAFFQKLIATDDKDKEIKVV